MTTERNSLRDERDSAYDRIDHFLRNNLDDDNYAVYSDFLEQVYAAPHPAPIPEGWRCPVCNTDLKHEHAYNCVAAARGWK